jgi:hypothetical protein
MIPKGLDDIHFKQAAVAIDRHGVPAERKSVHYDLVIEGKRYPPKYIVSLATKFATGEEYPAADFNAVEAKNYFLSNGYEVVLIAGPKPKMWLLMKTTSRLFQKDGNHSKPIVILSVMEKYHARQKLNG